MTLSQNPLSSFAIPNRLPDVSSHEALGSGTITRLLGEGGAAVVYEIWSEKLGIRRAVKLLRPSASHEVIERFNTEMKITAQLRHPNIIEIHAVGEWHKLPYIEMEIIDGLSLEQLLKQNGALPTAVCSAIAVIVCRALHFMHTRRYTIDGRNHYGILHRDLKPANIMISNTGVVKIMDFGIATPTAVQAAEKEDTIVGSMQYLAPELLQGKQADSRSDLYSFGTIVYEMITGFKTFPSVKPSLLIPDRLNNDYLALKRFKIKIPPRLRRVVEQCLVFDPARRTGDAESILRELERVHRALTPLGPEEIVESYIAHGSVCCAAGWRRPLLRSAMAISAAAALAGCVFWLYHHRLPIKTLLRTAGAALLAKPDTLQIQRLSLPPPSAVIFVSSDDTASGDVIKSIQPAAKPLARQAASRRKTPQSRALHEPLRQRKPPRTAAPLPAAPDIALPASLPSQPLIASMPAPAATPMSFADSLRAKHGNGDLMMILASEVRAGAYATAQRCFYAMTLTEQQTPRAQLYYLRALLGMRDRAGLERLFSGAPVDDAEFLLEEAVFFFDQKRLRDALAALERAARCPAELSERAAVVQRILYQKALTITNIYEREGGEELKRRSLDAWFEVKYAFRSNQSHPYFATANNQIRRLTETP